MEASLRRPEIERASQTYAALVWQRFTKHRLAFLSAIVLLCFCAVAMLGGVFESVLGISHEMASLDAANLPPSWPHLLGTNELGQDMFLRLVYGGRISLSVGIISALTSAAIGAFVGLLAGYHGGLVDSILMRFTDAMLAIPVLPLMIVFAALDLGQLSTAMTFDRALLLTAVTMALFMSLRFLSSAAPQRSVGQFGSMLKDAAIVGVIMLVLYLGLFGLVDWKSMGTGNLSSVVKLIIIIVFFGWMTVARLARAAALQLKSMEFVSAAIGLGASHSRILMVHILPNALAPIIVSATLEVGGNILYEAALSFLGLGIQPPVASWGNMLNNAVEYIKTAPMLAFWPGFFILVTVACFNFFGDGMRDALDPHQVMKTSSKV
jgi:peptide/nickel transport system permease protein